MVETQPRRLGHDLGDDALVDGGVADDAALADVVAAGLELRLDERDDVAAGREQRQAAPAAPAAAR